MVRIRDIPRLLQQRLFLNDATDQDEIAGLNDVGEFDQEIVLVLPVLKELEIPFLLSNFMFMQDNQIMAEVVELELLESWHNPFAVIPLVEDTEGKDKYRIIDVDGLHTVIATFIHINDKIAELPKRWSTVFRYIIDVFLAVEQGELFLRRRGSGHFFADAT